MVRASGQCQSRNSRGFDPSILRHSGIRGAADEAVYSRITSIKNIKKIPLLKSIECLVFPVGGERRGKRSKYDDHFGFEVDRKITSFMVV